MGIHASNSHAGGMFIFISTNISNSFQSTNGYFSTTTKQYQPQTIIQPFVFFIQYFTTIHHNKYHPWFVDEGSIYIYIYIIAIFHLHFDTYINYSMHVKFILRLYSLHHACTWGIQHVCNLYFAYIIYTRHFPFKFF